MLSPKLIEQFFGAASIQRWNDYPRMVELVELDKQAHKFIIAYFFWWSGKSGQFDDLEGPAHRILMDDDSTDRLNADEKPDTPPEAEQEAEKNEPER